MADKHDTRGGSDKGRTPSGQEHEVRNMAQKMNVSEDEVRRAMQQVGNDPNKIEQWLRSNGTR